MNIIWIEKTKTGFRAVERYKDPVTGKDRRVSVAMEKNTASTRKNAEKAIQTKISQKASERSVSVSFDELVHSWLEWQKTALKPSTCVTNGIASNAILKIVGSDSLVDNLTARFVMQSICKYYDTPSKQNYAIKYIKKIMRWGYDNDYVHDISWLSKLKPRKYERKVELKDKYLEREELDLLINSMEKQKHREMTMFLALTGMRIGEALALEYTDIDLSEKVIRVTKTFSTATNKVQTAKTADSVRDIYIQDELQPLCTMIRARASANRFISPLVFHGYNYKTYAQYLQRHSREALGREITPHVLRHTHVALLAENGISLETISRRLGHRDVGITRDVYFHATQKLKEKDNQAIKQVSIL